MGDFVKASTDPGNIMAALFVVGSTVLGGPAGFLASSAAVASASASIKGTGAQEVDLELAKRQEKLAAKDREVQRQERLNAVLGSQRAAAAASGVAFSGSVANVSISDAERASIDRLVDRQNTRIQLNRFDTRKKAIRRIGNMRAGATILSTAATIGQGIKINKPAGGTTIAGKGAKAS